MTTAGRTTSGGDAHIPALPATAVAWIPGALDLQRRGERFVGLEIGSDVALPPIAHIGPTPNDLSHRGLKARAVA